MSTGKYDNVAFITLTNNGYIDYTLNCLKSLDNIQFPKPLHCYCIGEQGYNQLKEKGYTCTLLPDTENDNFQVFRTGNWSEIVSQKFDIIHENLKTHEFVCITDGDIVYENKEFMDYLLNTIGDNDMITQVDAMISHKAATLCSGFMFIKSNPFTLRLFDPIHIEQFRHTKGWGDQVYINQIKHILTYDILPLSLFPTGAYFYQNYKRITPYLIHFNWVKGSEKKVKLISHGKWFI